MVVYNFKGIPPVPTNKQFVDIVLLRTQRKTPTVVHAGCVHCRLPPRFSLSPSRRQLLGVPRAPPTARRSRAPARAPAPLLRAQVPDHAHPRLLHAQGQVHAGDVPRQAGRHRRRLSEAGRHPPLLRRPHQRAVRPRPLQVRATRRNTARRGATRRDAAARRLPALAARHRWPAPRLPPTSHPAGSRWARSTSRGSWWTTWPRTT